MSEIMDKLRHIIRDETKHLRDYRGKVINVIDPEQRGRVQVTISALGWDSPEKGVWAYPIDTMGVYTPQVDDYLLLRFTDAQMNKAYYIGRANEMQGMLPDNYDQLPTTQIPYESNDGKSCIKHDELLKQLEIVMSYAEGQSDTIAMTPQGIKLSGNLLELDGQVYNIGTASEAFVKGDSFKRALDIFLNTLNGLTGGSPQQNAAAIEGIKLAASALKLQMAFCLSETIKGE